MGFINSASFSPTTVSKNTPPPPSDPKASPPPPDPKTSAEAKVEAAKVLGNFAAEVNGPITLTALDKGDLKALLSNATYNGELKKNVEIPKNVRDAAQMLLADDEMFNRVDSNNDNLLSFNELNAFASTNETISKIFKI